MVRAIMIIELMGRPAEHAKQSLEKHAGKLRQEKGVEVFSISVSEPKRIEDAKTEIYTCFAEVELETENFAKLTDLIFDFMPSSVEVLSPENIKMNIADSTNFLNNLSGRLHRYDEIATIAQIKNQQLANQLAELMKEKGEDKKKDCD